MKLKYITQIIIALTITLLFVAVKLIFPYHPPLAITGRFGIAESSGTYIDAHRIERFSENGKPRIVNVTFWYPRQINENETFPLIIFSHGGLGTESSNESLYRELASHGYIVCSISHPYHTLWTKDEDGRNIFVSLEYFLELQREDAQRDRLQSFQFYQKWMETRTGDINFVIDTIIVKVASSDEGLYGFVDVDRIGVMGHSLGGSAALAMPRLRDDIDAVIALESPFLFDIIGVEDGEFVWNTEKYLTPVLNIYSDSSWDHLSEWPQYALNAALRSEPTDNVFSSYLPGAGHFSLTDLPLVSPLLTNLLEDGQLDYDRERYLREVNQSCLEFFNIYLKKAD